MRLDENRNLLTIYLLSLITCGIYGTYIIWQINKDFDRISLKDGQETQSLVVFFLLCYVTCGIYLIISWYNLGNRTQEIGQKLGVTITENGTTMLMWYVIGTVTCGIGTIIGFNYLIKNCNAVAHAYNMTLQ